MHLPLLSIGHDLYRILAAQGRFTERRRQSSPIPLYQKPGMAGAVAQSGLVLGHHQAEWDVEVVLLLISMSDPRNSLAAVLLACALSTS